MVFVRNVKFSAAECNSFNMRKKNVGYLAFKKNIGGSHAKKQPSGCKVTTIVMQSYNLRNVIPNLFSFNLAYLPTINASLLTKRQSLRNCIIIQFECIFMQFWGILSISIVKLKHVFYTLFYIYSVK